MRSLSGVEVSTAIWRRAAPGLVLLVAVLLFGCATQLAPSYDEQVDHRLAALNQRIATFVAAVPPNGYARESFETHQTFYADTLGEIAALRARAAARPVPRPVALEWLGLVPPAETTDSIDQTIPTVESLELVAEFLREVRDLHRDAGISQSFAEETGDQIQIALNNAITYELALRR